MSNQKQNYLTKNTQTKTQPMETPKREILIKREDREMKNKR